MSYAKGKNFNVVFLPLRYSAGDTYRGSGLVVLILPMQWTIANPVGADRPAKRQKKTSCVSTGQPVPVLCTRQVAHRTSFLSRQSDVIASFSFGACTVQTCFQQSPDILRKNVDYDRFSTLYVKSLV